MTTTPPLPPFSIYTTGIDYSIIPLEPPEPPDEFDPDPTPIGPRWKSVIFNDLPNAIVLNGYRIGSRFYTQSCVPLTGPGGQPITDPDTGEQQFRCTKNYPSWEILEQTLVKTSPSRQVFGTDEGTELFTADPGVYGDDDLTDADYGEYAYAGITDGTTYEYARVFDKSDISYWPRASTPNQPLIENPSTMPSGDDQYLIDTLTSFVPDSRETILITYELTTTYKATPFFGGFPVGEEITATDTLTITQEVNQNTDDVGDKIQAYLKRSYYTDGKYHIQLHDGEAPDLYDKGGELIRPQDYKVPEYQETSEGYLKLINSVTPVTPDDILKETLNTSVEELNKLINMIDDYEFPE